MAIDLSGRRFESQVIPADGAFLAATGTVTVDVTLPANRPPVRGIMVNNSGTLNLTIGDDEVDGINLVQGILYPFYVTAIRAGTTTGTASGVWIFY